MQAFRIHKSMSRAAAIASVICGAALACGAQAQAADIAKVNGVAIPQSRADMLVKQATPAGQTAPDTPEVKQRVREQLIDMEVVAQEAQRKGLDRDPEVSTALDMSREQLLVNAYFRDYVKNNPITEDAMKAEYTSASSQNAGKQQYHVHHILVKTDAEAKDIIAQLKKGGSFEKLAAKSEDTGSKSKGGDLGWIMLDTMVPEFADGVRALKKGKVSDTPVKSQFGYHVIRLDDQRAAQLPPYEDVKPRLQSFLQQQAIQKQVDALRAKAKIE